MKPATSGRPDTPLLSFWELVALLVVSTGIVALSIDIMLPALPEIAADLTPQHANDRQFVITAFLMGFGAAQLIYGPLSDAWGRRPVLLGALLLYTLATVFCLLAWSFEALLIGRFLQGASIAAARVVGTAIARDLTHGRRMAEVMSMAMMVFMAVPVMAPLIGQGILLILPWRWIFALLLFAGLGVAIWLFFRLPETLHENYRRHLDWRDIFSAYRECLRHRALMGYMLAGACFFGGLYGFLNSAEQVLAEYFGLGEWFVVAFAIIASIMAITNFINSRLVVRLGQRRLSQGALISFIAISTVHSLILISGVQSVVIYVALLSMAMMLLGLIAANFNALAMEPVGHIAGTASAAYGFGTGVIGAIIGAIIGQMYDGTGLPLIAGQACTGLAAFLFVVLTERGQLFGEGTQDE